MAIDIHIVQEVDPHYLGSATSNTQNAFSSTPIEGNLLIWCVDIADAIDIVPPGDLVQIYEFQSSLRTIGIYAKIAGDSESTARSFTVGTAKAMWVFAQEWYSSTGWQDLATAVSGATYDSSGSVHTIDASVSSPTGSLIFAMAYTANSTANNKSIVSGYSALKYSSQLGTSLRAASAYKVATGAETATLSIVDNTDDGRISLVLAAFLPNAEGSPGPSIDSAADATPGESSAVTVSGFSGAITGGTIDGVALTAASDTAITPPGFTDEQPCPFPGLAADTEARTLSLTDGTDSDTIDIDVYPPWIDAGKTVRWVATTLAGTLNTTVNGVLYNYSPAAQVGDIIYNDPAKGLMFDNGDYLAYTQHQTLWHHEAATRIVRSVALDIGAGTFPRLISASFIQAEFIRGKTIEAITI